MAYRTLNLETKSISSPAPEKIGQFPNPPYAYQPRYGFILENSRSSADSMFSQYHSKPIAPESRNLMNAMEGAKTKSIDSRHPQNLKGSVDFQAQAYGAPLTIATERTTEPLDYSGHKEEAATIEVRKSPSKSFSFKTSNPQFPLRLFPKWVLKKSMKNNQPTLEDLLKPGSIKLSQAGRLKIKSLIHSYLPIDDILLLCSLFDTKPPITFLSDPLNEDFAVKRIFDGLCKEDFSYLYRKFKGTLGFQETPSYEELSSKFLESDKMIEADVPRTSAQYMDIIPYLE
jgi:hypothetical protein